MLTPVPSISSLKTSLDQAVGFREALKAQESDLAEEIVRLERDEHLLVLCSQFLRALADDEVNDGVEAVTKLQTEGLQEIFFDKNLSVEAEVTESRGKVSVDLFTVDKKPDGSVVRDHPLNSFGGSVATVESVLLRLIVILRRDLRPLLVFDETLFPIARSYVERMALFLTAMCQKIPGGMDVLAISHDPLLVDGAQKAYTIEAKKDGSVSFRELRSGKRKDP